MVVTVYGKDYAPYVEFDGISCEQESTAAILVRIYGYSFWIPKSQIHDDSEVYKKGTEGTLIVSEWIAIQKGLV